MNILTAVGLSKVYGKGPSAVDALKSIDLDIKEGEFVAITGASGSGKSTLLHLLGGLDRPTAGQVLLEGKELYKNNEKALSILRRRKFGFVFQFYNLIPVLTVEENITFPLLLDGRPVDTEYINELLDLLHLKDRKHHLPNALSGGQQQRTAIGRALANKPSIIFADEPTGNLDTKTSHEIMELLRLSIKRYHQNLVIVTHDMDIANSADRILSIQDGSICFDRAVSL